MANRFWVGGAGNWSSTTKWSATSGGASGASVPTSVDDVIFDANSGGKFTATVDTAQTVNSISITPSAAVGVLQIALSARLTTGALTTTGTAGNNRILFRGTTLGIAQDFSISGAVSISDCDFRDVYVIGTSAPISGTRIGDFGGVRGVTVSTPKTVYWNLAAGGNWSDNAWAATSGGGVSTDNFPLIQDTAIIENTGLNTSATVTLDAAYTFMGTIDMSNRTNAMTLTGSSTYAIYGNWLFGSGVTRTYTGTLQFSGRKTQTITSAGKSFVNNFVIDTYGGTVQLADALSTGAGSFTLTNGTFDTQGYSFTTGFLSSSNTNVRALNLRSSTVTVTSSSGINFLTPTNFSFTAGTSSIVITSPTVTFSGGGLSFYNVSYTDTSIGTITTSGANTFNNVSVTSRITAGVAVVVFSANQTITGTLTVAGASAVRRIFVRSDTFGTQRDLTVGTLVATDCDFRDIDILGTAAGTAPTRAGDCGGNAGITFPAPKTVYWNLAGTQNWSATGWATTSGGTPAVNNFPLAQDTAVFDNTGSVTGTITINATWNIGTFDASLRTTAMTFNPNSFVSSVYGDWKFGTGVTCSSTTGTITFASRGTQTITSNGVTFNCPVLVAAFNGTVQLGDALTISNATANAGTLTLSSGTFDAVTYNVTAQQVIISGPASPSVFKMGSGTWTLTGTAGIWNAATTTNLTLYKGTANIVLSDTSTTARTFAGGALSYNKLTIGGATGISTTTITGNNQFTELASTKTVAHTIALGTTTQTFGKWTVTGTVGNVVTLTGTGVAHILAGACTSGINYLAMGSIGFAATSPGEFYAGVNSTGTAAAPVYRTDKPADSTRYWVGGTGNWSSTTKWSATSGGGSGASVPRSHDDVVFDSASNATAYTATVDAVTGGIRCKALTIAGPASGNVTLAGSTAIVGIHGNVTLPATGLTRTYTGNITLSGSTSGKTLTTNGVTLSSAIVVNGANCGWVLGSALNMGATTLTVINGSFDLATYNLTAASISSDNLNARTVNFGTGTITLSGSSPIEFGTAENTRANLTVTAGTAQINLSTNSPTFSGNNQTFYNFSFTSTAAGSVVLNGQNTFNNLTVGGITASGLRNIFLGNNQTVNGTLTISAGTDATMRTFVQSTTLGVTRTITTAAFSGTDADFRDTTIAGAAAPISGTRLGDCGGNSGITFPAAKTVYWNLAAGGNWSATGWAATSGGTPATTNFPLAQDTAVFEATGLNSGATVTLDAAYNIGTIDMSARTTNTMTLATGSIQPHIYGNWINGTGTTLTGTQTMTFAGRGSQTITSAGKTFTQAVAINTPGGSVTLTDAYTSNSSSTNVLSLVAGTFDAATYNVTLSSGSTGNFASTGVSTRTLAIGSGTWTIANSGSSWNVGNTGITVTGTGTVSLTSASAKTFNGGTSYAGITLNQGGAGTLTITGDSTFANITNTYKATGATSIALGNTTQRVGTFTAAGEAGRVLTITGTSAASPATLILTGAIQPNVDYLTITGVRAYDLTDTWYAGANSTNNGSLGWYFEAAGGGAIAVFITESSTAADAQSSSVDLTATVSELSNAADAIAAGLVYIGTLSESATAADLADAVKAYLASIEESATSTDLIAASLTFAGAIAELTSASDATAVSSRVTSPSIAETVQIADALSGGLFFLSDISESAVPADIAASVLIFNRAVSEATTASEVIAAVAVFRAAVPEQVSGSDVLSALLTAGGSINEALTALDSILGPKITSPTVAESATVSETLANVYTANPSIAELVQGAETAQVVASTFGAAAADTAQALDAGQGANTGSSSLSESAAVNETSAAAFTATTTLSEAATGAEASSALAVFEAPVAESAVAEDQSLVIPSTFSAVALAVAQALDVGSPAGSIYNAILPTENAGISDTALGSYLWNTINDNQTVNWQNVPNPQGSGWTTSSTDVAPDWQNVPNPQGSVWTTTSTDIDPDWHITPET